ncbi:MAG TPA: acetate--CoA ligase [Saprospiraceae bacterium]|nr:acetate--CoA ligase [Saprospiraceae bacterium]HPI08340.1 acetate--CoA ligase [Saprospiraceae bacterium]
MTSQITTFDEYKAEYERSVADPEGFWAEQAATFQWKKPWKKVLKWNFREPEIKWFLGGKLNITENVLDRHLPARAKQTAIIWEQNDPAKKPKKITYKQLYQQVCQFANALKAQGIKKGDRVCIYMPMTPELAVAVLACARVGAIHSVVFAGFSAVSVSDRIKDAQCNAVITSDYNARGAKNIPVKQIIDEALELGCDSVKTVIVHQNTGDKVNWTEGRDHWWHEVIAGKRKSCKAQQMDSEDPLFILYTSGSTGKPKGVVHTHGGYMVYTEYTFRNVFQYQENEIYWCTADIGWITGHSYIIYGPLLAGATSIIFEGVPTFPNPGRFWDVIQRHKVNIFYTAPTAIRALMAAGDEWVKNRRMPSLRVLGTVGEPINEEAWNWYNERIGKKRCPIVDTWWQTETGGIMITPIAGITRTKPCYATLPLPGIQPVLVDASGTEITGNDVEGMLCIKFPWPSILRTTYGDHERCRQNYFATFKNLYFTGDGVRRDHDGYYRIIGRVDDVINVSGHRIGTAEVEDAINKHDDIVESAVVGFPHDIKGQGIYAYVIVTENITDHVAFRKEVMDIVSKEIGPIAKPDKIQIVPGLPKTRSGKIMRRILRKIAEGDTSNLGDISTLLNPEVVEEIKVGAV